MQRKLLIKQRKKLIVQGKQHKKTTQRANSSTQEV